MFQWTMGDSKDIPGATMGLNLVEYDIATAKATHVNGVTTQSGSTPFPLMEYKGNFNTTVDHAWASVSHFISMHGKPYYVLFSGGSGNVAMYNIKDDKWLECENDNSPARFSVPLPSFPQFHVQLRLPSPHTTCYTHVIRDKYLIVNRVEKNSKDEVHPKISFAAFNLETQKWLLSYAVNDLFNHTSYNPYLESPLKKPYSPNQFFINKIRPMGQKEAMTYGIIQAGEKLGATFYFKPVDNIEFFDPSVKKDQVIHSPHYFPIKAKVINQTRSEVLSVNGENILIIPTSITTEDGKNKLVFLLADFNKNIYDHFEYDLPSVNLNADWQAMHTTVAMIGGKQQLIVTLLDPDYRMMIFSYDPASKHVTRLEDGPKLEPLEIQDNKIRVLRKDDMDHHLLKTRKMYPGYYPVNSYQLKPLQSIIQALF